MKRTGVKTWRVSVLAMALAVAGAGGLTGWSQSAATLPAVTPANHQAALDAFRQARTLYQQEKYSDSYTLNAKALQLDPTLQDAQLLQKILQARMSETGAAGTAASGGDTHAPSATGPVPKVKMLTTQQMSMVRLQELAPDETTIRGHVARKTLDAFWNEYVKMQPGVDLSQTAYNSFVSPNNFVNQVKQIRDSKSPQYTDGMEITSDPADMLAYRTTVQPFILQNCATAVCHGGEKAGSFRLIRPAGGATDQIVYTNFYIMSQYVTRSGGQVINRDDPEKSLFLQYSLPKALASYSHPAPVESRARFADENAPEYHTMLLWVKGLAYPKPNYGITYEIPGMTPPPVVAATMPRTPATKPATRPVAPVPSRPRY